MDPPQGSKALGSEVVSENDSRPLVPQVIDERHGVLDLIRADDGIHLSGPESRRGGLTGGPGFPPDIMKLKEKDHGRHRSERWRNDDLV